MYGIPLAILFPWSGWRPDAQFVATLKTRAVDFTVAHYEGAGFAGDRADIGFESFDHVELPNRDSCAAGAGTIQFRNVKVQSLPLPHDTKVRIEWSPQSPTGARMVVQYRGVPPQSKLFLDEQSSASIGTCKIRGAGAGLGAAKVYPKAGQPLIVNIDPVSLDSKKPVELAFDQSRQVFPGPHGMKFRVPNQSAIMVSDGNVQVLNADRKEPVRPQQEFAIDALGAETRVTDLRIGKDGIAITIDGRAGVLSLDGRDIRPSLAEYLHAQKILSVWLATAILAGSAGLTVASRIKLVKLDGKDG
jgi:hypothetical protein